MDRPLFTGYTIGVGLAVGAAAALLLRLATKITSMLTTAASGS
jgi:gas vesicle protein